MPLLFLQSLCTLGPILTVLKSIVPYFAKFNLTGQFLQRVSIACYAERCT